MFPSLAILLSPVLLHKTIVFIWYNRKCHQKIARDKRKIAFLNRSLASKLCGFPVGGKIIVLCLRMHSIKDRLHFNRVYYIFMSKFRSHCPLFLSLCLAFCDTGLDFQDEYSVGGGHIRTDAIATSLPICFVYKRKKIGIINIFEVAWNILKCLVAKFWIMHFYTFRINWIFGISFRKYKSYN